MPTRILILTAGFGEGHNSAARNLSLALENAGAESQVADPCMLAIPRLTRSLCQAYRFVTTYQPRLWARIYRATADVDFSRQRLPLMRRPERRLGAMIEESRPDAIVSTYPLYPYFLQRIFAETGNRLPVFTAVTDSIEVNAAWIKAPGSRWLVTDGHTRRIMIDQGLDASRIVETGFPVHPDFASLPRLGSDAPVRPFDVLYFATAKLPHVRRISTAVLNASPDTRITIVLGKNVRLLYRRAREIKDRFPGRVRIKGWSRKVPELLCRHHLVIGKAGGATVHEAIAARCPMLVHHLVPGQEEGNLELLRRIGGGDLAASPEAITRQTGAMLADRAGGWRRMKTALARHGHSAGSVTAARFILETTAGSAPGSADVPVG